MLRSCPGNRKAGASTSLQYLVFSHKPAAALPTRAVSIFHAKPRGAFKNKLDLMGTQKFGHYPGAGVLYTFPALVVFFLSHLQDEI